MQQLDGDLAADVDMTGERRPRPSRLRRGSGRFRRRRCLPVAGYQHRSSLVSSETIGPSSPGANSSSMARRQRDHHVGCWEVDSTLARTSESKPAISTLVRGRPGARLRLPSYFLATSSRYDRRTVSGVPSRTAPGASDRASSRAHRDADAARAKGQSDQGRAFREEPAAAARGRALTAITLRVNPCDQR